MTKTMKVYTFPILFSAMSATSAADGISSTAAKRPNTLRSPMQQSRFLEDNNNNDDQGVQNNNGFDLSQYSIQFEQCQTTKQYDYNGGDGNSVLSTKRFVIFRLCPDSSCSNYGEYLIDIDSYLEATVDHMAAVQEQYCEECYACVGVDDDATCGEVDVNTCYSKCQNIDNMETNGYVDAVEYTQCGKVYYNQNTGVSYYAGAMCSSSGTKIKIGLFADAKCSVLADADNIDHYIKNENGYNVKLSYHLLKQTFSGNENGYVANCYQDGAVSDMCQALYEEAGKCESVHGFSGMTNDDENYSSQISNEQQVCEFISKIRAGHYDQSGEIVLTGMSTYLLSGANLSDSQIFALTFFAVGCVGLVMYAMYLRRKIFLNQRNLRAMSAS